ncbi:deoxyribose-phosphate aldolase [Schistocerca piceifrons]|uniref:deoxyribose-phosphate aldolase n=1 Tax=Schistocerca piceifrons TaxID=274613 RepID=UPI001F5FCA14|nr:deoxyribose-phosphate aldolase [Schistocerca piceifrons]
MSNVRRARDMDSLGHSRIDNLRSEWEERNAFLLPFSIIGDAPNLGCHLDVKWINEAIVNTSAIMRQADDILSRRSLKGDHEAAWLLRAVTCIDLTTLSGDDTASNVERLCVKACDPIATDLLEAAGFSRDNGITTAAVCVYPARVPDAVRTLTRLGFSNRVAVASVATGFPSGQYPLETRLAEIKYAVSSGATEIDVVVDRSLVLSQRWKALYREIRMMAEACGRAHFKVILAVGELGTLTNIYRASLVAMMAGAHFIKTSTGKETFNATIPVSIVMCRAIRDYYLKTGYKVGFKPAGGIRTAKDALNYLILMKEELGTKWMSPRLFRIGASGLLSDIEKHLYLHTTGKFANTQDFLMG